MRRKIAAGRRRACSRRRREEEYGSGGPPSHGEVRGQPEEAQNTPATNFYGPRLLRSSIRLPAARTHRRDLRFTTHIAWRGFRQR